MNRIKMMALLAALALGLACVKKEPVLPSSQIEQFAKVYIGYLTICMSDTAHAEARTAYLQSELDRHQMSRTEFERIRQGLEADPQAFIDLLNRIEAGLEVKPARKAPPQEADPAGQAVPIVR